MVWNWKNVALVLDFSPNSNPPPLKQPSNLNCQLNPSTFNPQSQTPAQLEQQARIFGASEKAAFESERENCRSVGFLPQFLPPSSSYPNLEARNLTIKPTRDLTTKLL